MTMPGFTAEASFYKRNGHYRMVVTKTQTDSPVQAAFIGNCFSRCLADNAGDPYAHEN